MYCTWCVVISDVLVSEHNVGLAERASGESVSKWWWKRVTHCINKTQHNADQLLVYKRSATHSSKMGVATSCGRTRESAGGKRCHIQWQQAEQQSHVIVTDLCQWQVTMLLLGILSCKLPGTLKNVQDKSKQLALNCYPRIHTIGFLSSTQIEAWTECLSKVYFTKWMAYKDSIVAALPNGRIILKSRFF